MNISVDIKVTDDGFVTIEETDESIIRRVASDFGFDVKCVSIEHDEKYVYFNGSLAEDFWVIVKDNEYHIRYDYGCGTKSITVW